MNATSNLPRTRKGQNLFERFERNRTRERRPETAAALPNFECFECFCRPHICSLLSAGDRSSRNRMSKYPFEPFHRFLDYFNLRGGRSKNKFGLFLKSLARAWVRVLACIRSVTLTYPPAPVTSAVTRPRRVTGRTLYVTWAHTKNETKSWDGKRLARSMQITKCFVFRQQTSEAKQK